MTISELGGQMPPGPVPGSGPDSHLPSPLAVKAAQAVLERGRGIQHWGELTLAKVIDEEAAVSYSVACVRSYQGQVAHYEGVLRRYLALPWWRRVWRAFRGRV